MSVVITYNSPSPIIYNGQNPINDVSNSFYLPPFTYYLFQSWISSSLIQATISGTVYAVLVAPNGQGGTTSGGGGGGGGGGQIFCGVLPTGKIQITPNIISTVASNGTLTTYADVYSGKNGGDGGGSNAGNGGSGGSTTSSTASANYKINGGGGGGGGKGNNGGDNGNDGAAGYGYGGGSNGTKGSSGGDGGAGGYGTIDFYDNTPSVQWFAGNGGGKYSSGSSISTSHLWQTPFCLLYWIPSSATNPFYIYTTINNEPLTTFPTLIKPTATNPINGENPPDVYTMYYLIPPAVPFSTTYIYRTSADYPNSSSSTTNTCYLSVLGCPGSGGIYGTETNSTSIASSYAGGCGGGGTGTFGTIKFDVTQIPLINVSCPVPSPLSVTLIYNSSYAMEYLTVGGSFCSNITNIQNPPYVINFSTGLQGGNGDADEYSNSPNGGNGASGGIQYLNFDSGNLTNMNMNGGMGGAGGISDNTSGIVGASFNEQTGACIGSNGDNVSSMECVFPDTTTCTVVSGVGGFQGQVGGSGEAPFAVLTFYT